MHLDAALKHNRLHIFIIAAIDERSFKKYKNRGCIALVTAVKVLVKRKSFWRQNYHR